MGQVCTRKKNKSVHDLVIIQPQLTSIVTKNGGGFMNENKKICKEVQFVTDHHQLENNENLPHSAIRICLLGVRKSGKSTILEQIRKMSKVPPTDFEFCLRKSFIYDNCVNSMRKILEYMRISNIALSSEENEKHAEIILLEERTHGNTLNNAEYEALSSLWKDKAIRDLFAKKVECCLNDSTEYFMDNLPRIAAIDYKPSHDDLLMAYIPTIGVQNVIFSVSNYIFQLFEIGGSKMFDRKLSSLFEGLDTIIFTIAISVYDQKLPNGQMEFEYSMGIFDQLCRYEKFNNIPLYVFLNKCDIFKEKLQRVPLHNYFPDYKGNCEKDSFRFMRDYVRKRCHQYRKNISNVEFYFICGTDTKQTSKLMEDLFNEIIENRDQ